MAFAARTAAGQKLASFGPARAQVVKGASRVSSKVVTAPRSLLFSRSIGGQRLTVQAAPTKRSSSSIAASKRLEVVADSSFDSLTLTRGVTKAIDKLKGVGELDETNVKGPLKDIRRALLEADVSLPVVRRFVKRVELRALGKDVVQGVKPEDFFVKIVYDELTKLMGGKQVPLVADPKKPVVVLMAGLQGVGKTTACGKLALYLQRTKKKVLMVATDVYRPAAIDQLKTLGESLDIPVFDMGTDTPPPEIARRGVEEGTKMGANYILVDTSGRLQVDEKLMGELKATKEAINPDETLLVVDAMTGQESAVLANTFNDAVGITGTILTKLDGDSRGGAALSVREVSGRPIKFTGVGEKLNALEPFYPERMASRVLGMGDVITLVERAEAAINAEEAAVMQKKLLNASFDFNDFLKQIKSLGQMGSIGQVLRLLPGMNKLSPAELKEAERSFYSFEKIINAMDEEERSNPDLLLDVENGGAERIERLAAAADVPDTEVRQMLSQFNLMRIQMANLGKMMSGELPDFKKPLQPGMARRRRKRTALPTRTRLIDEEMNMEGAAGNA